MHEPYSIKPESLGVVIPSYKRASLLCLLLRSLKEESLQFLTPIDVVVVDDSPPDDAQKIRDYCIEFSARYIYLKGNVSQKRNHGFQLARGDIILFLDSDVEVRPGLLNQHFVVYQDPDVGACLGLVTFVGNGNWLTKIIEESPLLAPFSSPLTSSSVTWGPSANFSVLRNAFDKVGKFDETRSPPGTGGEDVDLGLRLTKQGWMIVTSPQAEVWHSKTTWSHIGENVRRFISWGRGDCLLIAKHPELSFVDVPSLFMTSVLVTIYSIIHSIVGHHIVALFGAVLFPFATSIIYGSLHPAPRASFVQRMRRAATLLLMSILDYGRLLESIKLHTPWMALKRFRFSQNQIFEEWNDLVITCWAIFLSIVLVGFIFW